MYGKKERLRMALSEAKADDMLKLRIPRILKEMAVRRAKSNGKKLSQYIRDLLVADI